MSPAWSRRLGVGALLVALAASVAALEPRDGPVAEGVDCSRAARVVDGGLSRLLCGRELARRDLVDGELVVDGVRGARMAPDEIAFLGLRVDVNTASAAELDTLPRVGPVLARRIIEGRPYGRVDELLEVKGIGPKTLERLRERAVTSFSPPPSR